MALLASPAIDGYHSKAKYTWSKDGDLIVGENTALLFCSQLGVIVCHVSALGQTAASEFIVNSEHS